MPGHFDQKTIVLGITGSIAAYKACDIASRLVEAGATVIPVLTRSALQFVGAASLEGICGRRAVTDLFEPAQNPDIEHIAVARRADLYLIAPATADILARHAHGIADDWLTTTLLATRAPVLFAPAMNAQMYAHPATQANVALLRDRGCHFVGPDSGRLACGEVGPGRLIDTRAILEAAIIAMCPRKDLAGCRILLTSGANHEPVDPVRYLGNRSSGKMGHALALEALCRGAEVTVVAGPCEVPPPAAATVVRADTARDMLAAVEARAADCDIFIAAAAVADYHVADPPAAKQKRGKGTWTLSLEPNPDITAAVAARRRPGQLLVGFAAETHDVPEFGAQKRAAKGLDLIVANRVGAPETGFGSDTNQAWLVTAQATEALPLLGKSELAARILDRVQTLRG
jgi:phosphopantothenoylcysteine decarboxylase/phosphopantothenate--cysteine ligase